jgi:hypothetical protein
VIVDNPLAFWEFLKNQCEDSADVTGSVVGAIFLTQARYQATLASTAGGAVVCRFTTLRKMGKSTR